jgi:hypothetical protein
MLPDLPVLKREIQRVQDEYLQGQIHRRLGVFYKSPKHIIHEGDRMRVIRADGSLEESELKRASGEMTLKFEDIPLLTVVERVERLNVLAQEIADNISKNLFESLNKTLEAADRVVDGMGKPFDAETIFAGLDGMAVEFDEMGRMSELSIVVSPEVHPRVHAAFDQIRSDPTLALRYKELIERKRLEWRDREAARELAG